jgi:polysaccharide biosynthesis transport protein
MVPVSTVTQFPASQAVGENEVPAMPAPLDDQPFALRRLLGVLRRRRVLIVGIVALFTALAALYVYQLTPLYRAETLIVVEGNRQNVVDIESVAQGLTPDYYTNETEAAILASRANGALVTDRLNLYDNPLVNPALRPPAPGFLAGAIRNLQSLIGGDAEARDTTADSRRFPWSGLAPGLRRAALRDYLTDAFLAGLKVTPSQRSRILTIRYVSTDAAFAAEAANAVADVYIDQQRATKGTATARAAQWLNQRVGELRRRVIASERRLDDFRRKSGILAVGGTAVLKVQHVKLNARLVDFRAARKEAEARYRQVQKLLASPGGVETAAAVLPSPLIERLREQEAAVLQKLGELRTRLREGHPRMALARQELADLQGKIAAEIDKIVISLANELEIARIRESNLATEIGRLQRGIEKQADAEIALRAYMSEVAANKQLYETVLARFKETKIVDTEIQQADARIISRAAAPTGPFYPQRNIMILAALFLSSVLAIGVALALEMLDTGFHSLSQVEASSGAPALGLVPMLARAERRRWPHEVALGKPNGPYGEAIRSLRTALMLSSIEAPPRSVLVTSSIAAEGKTSVALSLAALAARSGQACLIIDCDLRHPSVHEALGVDNEIGLGDYLAGEAALSEVIDIDTASGLHYVTAGARAAHPTDLLATPRMQALMEYAAGRYGFIVLDTPPLLAVSDALVLVRHVDKTLFLVRWEKTRRDTAMSGLRQVIDAGADLAGVVLSLVDRRRQARYGYRDSAYYDYGPHKKYYGD